MFQDCMHPYGLEMPSALQRLVIIYALRVTKTCNHLQSHIDLTLICEKRIQYVHQSFLGYYISPTFGPDEMGHRIQFSITHP